MTDYRRNRVAGDPIPLLRHRLAARLRRERIQTVIDLMPHVWAPFVIPAIRSTGARYVVVAHDAFAHPGDWRALLKSLSDTRAALTV